MQEKQIKIEDLNVSYKQIGSGSIPIVLLHGWGINSDKYLKLIEIMSKENIDLKIIVPDLPGFGKSDEPNKDWNLDDYVEFVDKFIRSSTQYRGFELLKNILKKSNIKKIMNGGFSSISNSKSEENKQIILVGHSFGGRIAIKYTVKYPEKIDKLILTGAAGIKHPLSKKQKIFYVLAKFGKKIFSLPIFCKLQKHAKKLLYKVAREKDYHHASLRMKEIMKNVLTEDLTLILEKIKTPTLLVWGKLDHSTPLADGKLMNKKIEDSKLIVINDANHSLPYQKPEDFVKDVLKFINIFDFK